MMQGRGLIAAIVLAGILSLDLGSSSCRAAYSGDVETITFGTIAQEMSSLVFIAQQQAYFAENGLEVRVKEYDSGLASAEGLLKGEVDMAGATEFVVVGKAFQKTGLRVIATIDKFESIFAVSQDDGRIRSPGDLKGKRIGVTRQTITEFYLGRFLNLHGMSPQDVTLVDIKTAQYADALVKGEVDAIIAGRLNAARIEKELGKPIFMLPAQGAQPAYWNALGTAEWIATHPGTVNRFLRSLRKAEDYRVRYPDEAKSIVQKRLGLDSTYLASLWSEHQFSLSLDFSLIVAMNDQARWMLANNLASGSQVPDFKDYVYLDGLRAVAPGAVNIVR